MRRAFAMTIATLAFSQQLFSAGEILLPVPDARDGDQQGELEIASDGAAENPEVEAQINEILEKMQNAEDDINSRREEIGLKDDPDSNLTADELKLLEKIEEKVEPEKPKVPWRDIDMKVPKDNARVEKFRAQYLTNFSKQRFFTIIERARPYQKFIREKLREYSMPKCLEYLPVIESAFVVTAKSKAGAVGLWQFMKNSIAPYGIRANAWMDERRDPWLMTDVALKKLRENYRALGSWEMALAAYNAGLGGIRTRIKRAGTSDYWKLNEGGFLPPETADYVPRFLAVAEILQNAEYYGIDLPPEVEPLEFETAKIDFSVDILLVGEKLGVSAETMTFLNPALNYTITPSGMKYNLRFPAEKSAETRLLLADRDEILLRYDLRQVHSGDTFYDIARHYEISVEMLQKANPRLNPSRLQLGETILVPKIHDVAALVPKKSNKVFSATHVIEKGDTLWNLSKRYGVSIEDLAEQNGITVNSVLKLNAVLRVPSE